MIDFTLKRYLVHALLACPNVRNRHIRDAIVDDLPAEIRGMIFRHSADQVDTINIVSTCLNYENGLATLIEIVQFYEGDSLSMQTLNQVVLQVMVALQTPQPPPSEHHTHISSLLAQARQATSPPPNTPQRARRIDRSEVIVPFDLEDLESTFKRTVKYEDAFAFTVGVQDETLLQEYIVPRIARELRAKLHRPHRQLEVQLYQGDVAAGARMVERKLATRYACGRLCDLFAENAIQDIVLVVWNYDVPLPYMEQFATTFWNEACTQVTPYLRDHGRCFVVIWANIGSDPLSGFTVLPTPQVFDLKDLTAHFRSQLMQCELDTPCIDAYLARLQSHHGHVRGTFREMLNIIRELQGGVGYNE
ncbi:MAG: hypothetical protein JXA33_12820 [Anaerolineae bacterium]|nr:hypothetical protein [Anaerolineae bacterium]